jgi:hypothetical protein
MYAYFPRIHDIIPACGEFIDHPALQGAQEMASIVNLPGLKWTFLSFFEGWWR